MKYGICNLTVVPVRYQACHSSEMVTQILFGDHFKILEQRENWCKISIAYDNYQGWIDCKQKLDISEGEYFKINKSSSFFFSAELIDIITGQNNNCFTNIVLGSSLPLYEEGVVKLGSLSFKYEGSVRLAKKNKANLINTALIYLNTPYLWGGLTPLGIDCSGFTQMVYRLCGFNLKRDAKEQSKQGEALSFIEESEPGDLAFFDDKQGNIIHVGIIMKDNRIIHSNGKVRIDYLDYFGIYNSELQKHTHKLSIIRKLD